MQRDVGKRLVKKRCERRGEASSHRRISRGRIQYAKCLQDAADKNARSLSQEAEHRLMTSFGDEDIVLQALVLAYGEDVVPRRSLCAISVRTFRTVSELAGMSDINREAFVESFSPGRLGLIDNLLRGPVK